MQYSYTITRLRGLPCARVLEFKTNWHFSRSRMSSFPHAVQAFCRQLAGHPSNEAACERINQSWQSYGVSLAAAWVFVTMQPRREVRTMLSVFVVAVRVQTVYVAPCCCNGPFDH